MKPAPFDYVRPATLDEATSLLAQHGADATVLAGGVSLGAMLNMRLARPQVLVDIKSIDELGRVHIAGGVARTGATVVQARAMAAAALMDAVPLLAAAFPHIGHMQTRNRGTLGGSIAHADPSAELPLVLATLGGTVVLASRSGERHVPARDFFLGILATARRPDELVVRLEWPVTAPRTGHAFDEIAQRTGDFAIAAVAVRVTLDAAGAIATVDIGLGGVEDRPVVLTIPAMRGARPGAEAARAIATEATRDLAPLDDMKASRAYRRSVARYLAERVASQAMTAADMAATAPRAAPIPDAAAAKPRSRPTITLAADARAPIAFELNGRAVRGHAEPRMLLSDFLRHELQAYGVRVGCEHGVCGACTVLVDGMAVRSCLQRAVEADGACITTVEGLSAGAGLNPLQEAFRRHHALQCGFCTPGILASATQFLRDNPDPSEDRVRDMLSGHICRCTGYTGIVRAILDAGGAHP